jgi:hypothetical protein
MAKQIVRVLEAVQAGCRTSTEVSATTGLSVKTCSAWLSELALAGVVQRRGRVRFGSRGWSHVYEATR